MMKLYIQTENGQPVNHPALEENLLQAFGSIPDNWEAFVRVERPILTIYQILDNQEPVYLKVDSVWTDVWALRDMTSNEISSKQQVVKDHWVSLPNRENFTAWVFDEVTCSYIPPVSRPDDGKLYRWDGTVNNWAEVTPPAII
jgi:hypothetical protein